MNKDWTEVVIKTTSQASEIVQGTLYSMDVKGVSIIDHDDIEYKLKNPLVCHWQGLRGVILINIDFFVEMGSFF